MHINIADEESLDDERSDDEWDEMEGRGRLQRKKEPRKQKKETTQSNQQQAQKRKRGGKKQAKKKGTKTGKGKYNVRNSASQCIMQS